MRAASEVRPSPIAGAWYSGDPASLGQQVDAFMADAAPPKLDGEVVALIAPHAGYRYSGRAAGYAFRSVSGLQRELVAVVSPLHSFHSEPYLTSAHRAYQTPLGEIWIDEGAVEAVSGSLQESAGVGLTPIANDDEHSLEIELPFLQRALKGEFKLLPVMMRAQTAEAARHLGGALAEALVGRSALLVASTDLSHFYSEPIANKLDEEMLRCIESFSPEGVIAVQREGKGYACGAAPVAAVLWAARDLGAEAVKVLHYATSAEASGDRSSVVGYGAAAVIRRQA